jgi:hypothetical protein
MTNVRDELAALVTKLIADGAEATPADPQQLDDVFDGLVVPAPPEIRELYLLAEGLEIGLVAVFTLAELADVNTQPGLREYLGAPFYFGSDGGDGFFYVDTIGAWAPRGAIVWADRASPLPNDCIPCGSGLVAFLADVAAGAEPWDSPTNDDRWVEEVAEFLGRRDAYVGERAPDIDEVVAAVGRCGTRFPAVLDALLERTNGLAMPRAGVVLYRAAEIEPIGPARGAHTLVEALWIGAREGARFALSLAGWRGLAGGVVVEVVDGTAPSAGKVLGVLPHALAAWADGGST